VLLVRAFGVVLEPIGGVCSHDIFFFKGAEGHHFTLGKGLHEGLKVRMMCALGLCPCPQVIFCCLCRGVFCMLVD
jgi:hypothetical protein